MTTIAYKDGWIAFDGRQTRGEHIVSDSCIKMREASGGARFFLAGCVCDEDELIAAYFGAVSGEQIDTSGFVFDKGELMMVGHAKKTGIWRLSLDPRNPDAIGSGAAYALAAMDMGATAEEAVKAASKRDIYTGGTITAIQLFRT